MEKERTGRVFDRMDGIEYTQIIHLSDALIPFLEGEEPFNTVVDRAYKLFVKIYKNESFICRDCKKAIYPKIKTNRHGIFIITERNSLVAGKNNKIRSGSVCNACMAKRRNNIKD